MKPTCRRVTVKFKNELRHAAIVRCLGYKSTVGIWKVEFMDGDLDRGSVTENLIGNGTPILNDLVVLSRHKDWCGPNTFYHVVRQPKPPNFDVLLRNVADGTSMRTDKTNIRFPTFNEELYFVCRHMAFITAIEQHMISWEQDWITRLHRIDDRMREIEIDKRTKLWPDNRSEYVDKLKQATYNVLDDIGSNRRTEECPE